jgi:predicted nucleotidyltransferase
MFRSPLMTALVTELYVGGVTATVGELATAIGTFSSNVSGMLPALQRAGIVAVQQVGRSKLVSANTAAPFYAFLRGLLEVVEGPPVVLAGELSALPGISEAYVYGSWAARATGVPGAMPADIDVLIIGAPDRLELADALGRAGLKLRRDVNPLVVTTTAWEKPTDAFLRGLRTKPLVAIALTGGTDGDAARTTGDSPDAGKWELDLL